MRILSNLFGKKNRETSSTTIVTPEFLEKVIRDYGYVLEHQAQTPGCVADVSKLPYPKETIKQALILGLKIGGDPRMKEFLRAGYFELVNWQEGVGEVDQGLDMTSIDLNGDVAEALKQFSEQNEIREKWAPIMERERDSLENELRESGLL